jgi:hypothetical protein
VQKTLDSMRKKRKENQGDFPPENGIENTDASPGLNAVGKPYSASFDPSYQVRHRPPNINRLYVRAKAPMPMTGSEVSDANPTSPTTFRARGHAAGRRPDPELSAAVTLLGALTDSTAEIRSKAVGLVVSDDSSWQSEFKAVTEAVADLYQQLSKAGK